MAETCPLAHFVGPGIITSHLTFVQHHAWPILLGMAQALPLLMQCLHPCLVCPLEGGGRYLLVCRCTSGLNLNQAIVQQDCPDLLLFFCSFCKPYRTTHSRAISNRGGCERYSLLSWENMTHRLLPSLHHGMLVASALFRKAFALGWHLCHSEHLRFLSCLCVRTLLPPRTWCAPTMCCQSFFPLFSSAASDKLSFYGSKSSHQCGVFVCLVRFV